jgi:hypothetical protein
MACAAGAVSRRGREEPFPFEAWSGTGTEKKGCGGIQHDRERKKPSNRVHQDRRALYRSALDPRETPAMLLWHLIFVAFIFGVIIKPKSIFNILSKFHSLTKSSFKKLFV